MHQAETGLAPTSTMIRRIAGLSQTIAGGSIKPVLACISHRIIRRLPNPRIFSEPPIVSTLWECVEGREFV